MQQVHHREQLQRQSHQQLQEKEDLHAPSPKIAEVNPIQNKGKRYGDNLDKREGGPRGNMEVNLIQNKGNSYEKMVDKREEEPREKTGKRERGKSLENFGKRVGGEVLENLAENMPKEKS